MTDIVGGCLLDIRMRYVQWAYSLHQIVPVFALPDDVITISRKLPSWTASNNHVSARGTMEPVQLFQYSLQELNSRIKGGVDGAAQFREMLDGRGLHVRWDAMVAIIFLKTLTVSGFVAWILSECKHHLRSARSFIRIEKFREELYRTSSFPGWISRVCEERLQYATVFDFWS